MKSVALFVFTLMVAATCLAAAEPKAIGLKAASFTLEDQFQNRWAWKDHWQGKPTVVVISDWKGSNYIDQWTQPLTKHFAETVQFIAIADLSLTQDTPSFMQGTLKQTLRGQFKDSYSNPILLDWEGEVVEYYRIRAGLPNVLFIDAKGMVRIHTWGSGKEDHVKAFITALEKML